MNVSKTVIVTFVVPLLISCSGSSTGSTQNDEVGSATITISGAFDAKKEGMATYSTITGNVPGGFQQFHWRLDIEGEEQVEGGDEVFSLSFSSTFMDESIDYPAPGSYEINADIIVSNNLTFWSVYEAVVYNSQFQPIETTRYTTLCFDNQESEIGGVFIISSTGTDRVTGSFNVEALYADKDNSECITGNKVTISGEFTATKSEF